MNITNALLRITDGSITKNFASGDGMKLIQYKPTVADKFDEPVEDTFIVEFTDRRRANNIANHQAINLLFQQARGYKRSKTGPRIYLEFDPGITGTYWRAQVSNGHIELEDETIGWQLDVGLRMTIHVTRQPSWDGARTQLPLSNINASDDTAGLQVNNSSHQIVPLSLIGWRDGSVIGFGDGSMIAWGAPVTGAENFVDIAGSAILGDLPAPIEIQIVNNKSGSARNKEFYLFHNVYSNPIDFNHMINADAFTGGTVTISDDATCQGGKKASLSWTGTVETLIATAPISSVLATNAAGGRFKIIARWKGAFPYTDMFLRFRLLTSSGEQIVEGDLTLIKSAGELADLDVTRLLPAAQNLANIEDAQLALYGFRNQTGTHTIVLNYLQISPISGDGGWKYFLAKDDGIGYSETLIHDDIEGRNYRVNTSGKESPNFNGMGGPILLVPAQDQRIYILECDKDGAAKIDQEWTVKLFYRPRRSSL